MESDDQKRPYSVLTKIEIREMINKEINQISQFFSVSKSDATVILLRFRWNSFHVQDHLGDDNKEKFLTKLGLFPVANSKQNESNSSAKTFDGARDGVGKKFLTELGLIPVTNSNQIESDSSAKISDGDGDGCENLISTPFCSHEFPIVYWNDYLSNVLNSDEITISCPDENCIASVGPDTIERFTEPVKEIYENYVLESYVESNKDTIKWCPGQDCEYVIQFHQDPDESKEFGVVCLCGYTFCWSCRSESHRPVTCNNAFTWQSSLDDRFISRKNCLTLAWIAANAKPCPNCSAFVELDGCRTPYRFLTCVCRYRFCSFCLRSDEEHETRPQCYAPPVTAPDPILSSDEYTQILHLDRWEENQEAINQAKSDLKTLQDSTLQDLSSVKEAYLLTVQCRQVLKWSYVYDYFLSEYQSAKKQYLSHLQDEAIAALKRHKEIVEEVTKQALVTKRLKDKLLSSIGITGSYFHEFVKNLEDGLPQVKANAYADVAGNYWFCDRCTFQNNWFDKHCKACFDPLASSSQ